MTTVRVTALDRGEYDVVIEQDGFTSRHLFMVPPSFWDDRGIRGVEDGDESDAVCAAAELMLVRDPGVAIPDVVSFDELVLGYLDFVNAVRAGMGR
jgi:hypothetical protein